MNNIFITNQFWKEINVSEEKVRKIYEEYLGNNDLNILSREESIKHLFEITSQIQSEMVDYLRQNNPEKLTKDLYKILNKVYTFYEYQKYKRSKLIEAGIDNGNIIDIFSENRIMVRNVIDSVNLWIENSLLFQDKIDTDYDSSSSDLNEELCIKMYIYGAASQSLSLIAMSKKFKTDELFTGVHVRPNSYNAINVKKYHPIIYFNPVLTGNQNELLSNDELADANNTTFGKGFKATYNISFIDTMRLLTTFEKEMFKYDKCAMIFIDKLNFIKTIDCYSGGVVDSEVFYDIFVLTKEKIESQKKKKDEIVWIMNANKYRHELRPFICFENERVATSYCAIKQAKMLWISVMLNGGMCYSNAKDGLTAAIEKRNEELSDRLVELIRSKLQKHYNADFDEIDVRYDRIFGKKEFDYGDYDLVFFSKEEKELFLIEAKFFSDSLNNSGIISDYEKMFRERGYYEHCRKRYDLVMAEPEKMKKFIGAEGNISTHFLFVSSKPLEIEFQDDDGIVSFPCLSIFDDYLEAKLLPDDGDIPVRPIHII